MIKPDNRASPEEKQANRPSGEGNALPLARFAGLLLKGSVSLDSQSPKGSLRIQFPCHPASGGTIGERNEPSEPGAALRPLFFQHIPIGVFLSVLSVFHVDALDFRGEAGEGVDAVYEVHEVVDGGFRVLC